MNGEQELIRSRMAPAATCQNGKSLLQCRGLLATATELAPERNGKAPPYHFGKCLPFR